MTGKAYGIGVGPGDSKLLTIRAVEVIRNLDVIFYPSFGLVNMALNIAKPYLTSSTIKLEMKIPLSPPQDKFDAYKMYSDQIINYLLKDKDVGVLCEGDPLFFGSFINIWHNIRNNYEVEIVPGISSVMSSFSQTEEFMGMGDDSISIITANIHNELIRQKIRSSDITIIIKIGNKFQKIKEILSSMKLLDHSIFISNIYNEKQFLSVMSKIKINPNDYFSIIIVKNNNAT